MANLKTKIQEIEKVLEEDFYDSFEGADFNDLVRIKIDALHTAVSKILYLMEK